jgi:hypothetical protein
MLAGSNPKLCGGPETVVNRMASPGFAVMFAGWKR